MKKNTKVSLYLFGIVLSFLSITFGCLPVNTPSIDVTDVDGNSYKTVQIGEQDWMKENLKVTHYSDGTAIPLIIGDDNWDALASTSKACCCYNDDAETYKEKYGVLYSWAAAMNGAASSTSIPSNVQGVCPAGWHLPSDKEWDKLMHFLVDSDLGYEGSGEDIGKSMAADWDWANHSVSGTVGNQQDENNESGFTAFPAGYRTPMGTFGSVRFTGAWWSSAANGTSDAWARALYYTSSDLNAFSTSKEYGLSVRCVRDKN